MPTSKLRIYEAFARLSWPRSYAGRIALISVAAGMLPVVALAVYLASGPAASRTPWIAFGVVTVAAVVGTALLLLLLDRMLQPMFASARALQAYFTHGEVPQLSSRHRDLAGRMMADVQYSLERLDDSLRELEHIAQTDSLTRTYNRFAAEQRLQEDVARSHRVGGTLIIALLGVDDFGGINARYGRRFADRCLKHVVDTVGDNTRAGDWLARWNEDHLLLGLWGAGEPEPEEILRRIVGELGQHPLTTAEGERIPIKLNVGAVRCVDGAEPEDLSNRADSALKEAIGGKGNGLVIR